MHSLTLILNLGPSRSSPEFLPSWIWYHQGSHHIVSNLATDSPNFLQSWIWAHQGAHQIFINSSYLTYLNISQSSDLIFLFEYTHQVRKRQSDSKSHVIWVLILLPALLVRDNPGFLFQLFRCCWLPGIRHHSRLAVPTKWLQKTGWIFSKFQPI